jgi:hypothetical protein
VSSGLNWLRREYNVQICDDGAMYSGSILTKSFFNNYELLKENPSLYA